MKAKFPTFNFTQFFPHSNCIPPVKDLSSTVLLKIDIPVLISLSHFMSLTNQRKLVMMASIHLNEEIAASLCEPVVYIFRIVLKTHPYPLNGTLIKFVLNIKVAPTAICIYGPISLLCIMSKNLEIIIYNKILPFLNQHIKSCRNGFLKKEDRV